MDGELSSYEKTKVYDEQISVSMLPLEFWREVLFWDKNSLIDVDSLLSDTFVRPKVFP